MTAQPPRKPA